MLTSDFDYELPAHLIAQTPLPRRDESRMMVLDRGSGEIVHSSFREFPRYLNKGDVLVLNSTRVIPAKAWGKIDKKEIGFLFLRETERGVWEVLCKPARKVKLGERITFAPGFEAEVIEVKPEGKRILKFSNQNVLERLKKIGYAPLPPYIKRKKEHQDLKSFDLERYQTVYAQKEGAIAAPTAGLHFTPEIFKKVKKRGVHITKISLDIGLATFKPVRAEKVEDHPMPEENYSIRPTAALAIESAKKESRPVFAVGTTVVRALESAHRDGKILAGKHSTSLFIFPGYEFKVVDRLLTNFHLPKSTLLMLVSAFSSLELIKKAYEEAIREKYRFYSFGDCMLIL